MEYLHTGNMEQHLGNVTLTTILHQPRGAMLRIKASVLVAIVLTFLTVVMGSCRRWSNHWFVQKGFLVANVLSLSLGTYSIGLMQSSSVKSEMFPIWSVSLFTLFGCVDSVTSYNNGLDYMSSLLKMIFQLCLYCGYVLLISITTISADVGNIAIGMLSAITFIKGFHRALALVLQSRMRKLIEQISDLGEPIVLAHNNRDDVDNFLRKHIIVDFPPEIDDMSYDLLLVNYNLFDPRWSNAVNMADIDLICLENNDLRSCYDVCVAFSLSHKLQRHFLGLSNFVAKTDIGLEQKFEVDYKWALKVIDIELAFLYESFFTGNGFLHYCHARSASVCSLASLVGICFVGVAVAIPGTMTSRGTTVPVSGTTVVDTTTSDLFITLFILVCLALLQLVQLIWCWTSNWARVGFACEYARWYKKKKMEKEVEESGTVAMEDVEQQACPSPGFAPVSTTTSRSQKKEIRQPICWLWWMRLKWSVVSKTNWFDKHLWQDKLGQCSLFADVSSKRRCKLFSSNSSITSRGKCARLLGMRGLRSIRQVARDLCGSNTKKGAAFRLDDDVKASITMFLHQLGSDKIEGYWLSSLVDNGVGFCDVPFFVDDVKSETSFGFIYALFIMRWHVATCYCELAEQEREKQDATSSKEEEREKQEATFSKEEEREKQEATSSKEEERTERKKNRRVAIALSRYCVYLVASAPELLPGPASDAKRVYRMFRKQVTTAVGGGDVSRRLLEVTPRVPGEMKKRNICDGVELGKRLLGEMQPEPGVRRCPDPWKALALVWVQMLLFGAPYGKAEAHMRHLSLGGEFITHLWALLYHLGVRKWELIEENEGESPEDRRRHTQDRELIEENKEESPEDRRRHSQDRELIEEHKSECLEDMRPHTQDREQEEETAGEEIVCDEEFLSQFTWFVSSNEDQEEEEESSGEVDIEMGSQFPRLTARMIRELYRKYRQQAGVREREHPSRVDKEK